MALKNGNPNALTYFGLRRVNFACPHFEYTTIDRYSPVIIKAINTWILRNLNNRYYIGIGIALDSNNTIIYNTKIGFESHKELSFFTIACPLLTTR